MSKTPVTSQEYVSYLGTEQVLSNVSVIRRTDSRPDTYLDWLAIPNSQQTFHQRIEPCMLSPGSKCDEVLLPVDEGMLSIVARFHVVDPRFHTGIFS